MTTDTATTGHYISIDIGGTGIKGGIVDLDAVRIQGNTLRLPTPRPATPHDIGDAVAQLADELEAEHNRPVQSSIGITFPGIIQHGISRAVANVDSAFINLDIQAFFTAPA
ncbi:MULTISPECIES: ROK family protein [unclassified Arthrobacter]|uniref:ROK family protein n=1 Tax=unclassified Arthrobacter TaxID=235627 RepID=UPI0027D810C1|nr:MULTISPECIES: ROK family protein [unclassified Arthrobacter]